MTEISEKAPIIHSLGFIGSGNHVGIEMMAPFFKADLKSLIRYQKLTNMLEKTQFLCTWQQDKIQKLIPMYGEEAFTLADRMRNHSVNKMDLASTSNVLHFEARRKLPDPLGVNAEIIAHYKAQYGIYRSLLMSEKRLQPFVDLGGVESMVKNLSYAASWELAFEPTDESPNPYMPFYDLYKHNAFNVEFAKNEQKEDLVYVDIPLYKEDLEDPEVICLDFNYTTQTLPKIFYAHGPFRNPCNTMRRPINS